jgi:hypothetical protein
VLNAFNRKMTTEIQDALKKASAIHPSAASYSRARAEPSHQGKTSKRVWPRATPASAPPFASDTTPSS